MFFSFKTNTWRRQGCIALSFQRRKRSNILIRGNCLPTETQRIILLLYSRSLYFVRLRWPEGFFFCWNSAFSKLNETKSITNSRSQLVRNWTEHKLENRPSPGSLNLPRKGFCFLTFPVTARTTIILLPHGPLFHVTAEARSHKFHCRRYKCSSTSV